MLNNNEIYNIIYNTIININIHIHIVFVSVYVQYTLAKKKNTTICAGYPETTAVAFIREFPTLPFSNFFLGKNFHKRIIDTLECIFQNRVEQSGVFSNSLNFISLVIRQLSIFFATFFVEN